jgi:hypothetical protein
VNDVLELRADLRLLRHGLVAVAGPPELLRHGQPHLCGRRDADRRHEDEERDAIGARRRERRHPAALADAPEPDAPVVDVLEGRHRLDDGHRVFGEQLEAARRRLARRSPLATPVERDRREADRRKSHVHVLEEWVVPRCRQRAVHRHERGRGRRVRKRHGSGEHDVVLPLDAKLGSAHDATFPGCYPSRTTFHRVGEMGARRPFFLRKDMIWPTLVEPRRRFSAR